MTTPICFIDCETTSLRPDRRIWDIALILRDESGERHKQWHINTVDLDLGNADPFSLRIGSFYERHPGLAELGSSTPRRESQVLHTVERYTRGAHLVGAVPNFDADVLDRRMRAHGILPAWHYHLIDVEALAVGYLTARGWTVRLPWESEELSRACGVAPADENERHTAIGDARWAMRLYDAITNPEATEGSHR